MATSTASPSDPSASPALPLLNILAAFPIAGFSGALLTDIAYQQTANIMWANFSAWLLAAGIAMAVLAAIVGLIVLILHRRAPRRRPVWPLALGSLLVLVLALFDNMVHSRDVWTSVVPLGLTLSALTVVVTLVTAWLGFAAVHARVAVPSYSGARQ